MTTAYRALALQARCHSLAATTAPMSTEETRGRIMDNLERLGMMMIPSRTFIGTDCRLVVLPEYALTGHAVYEEPAEWGARVAIDPDGKEYEILGAYARGMSAFLAVNAYETDRHFPGLYFQACVVLDPSGDVALRYRRLHSLMTPTPYDVWDRYLEVYGVDGVFPVARTPIGNLACIASEEILFPELARALALRGAEVFLHPTSEATSPLLTPKQVARRARAVENVAYVVSANSGGIDGSPIPGDSTNGGSQIVDFEGRVLAEAGPGESMVANAELDLDALRRARRRPGMANLRARTRVGMYAQVYADAVEQAPNAIDGNEAPSRDWFRRQHENVIERLSDAGLI